MINKIVGYSGFQTYGELVYPTRKQGKDLEIANNIWQSTNRSVDQKGPLENYHNNKTVYKQTYLQNTQPQNYHPTHVVKGQHGALDYQEGSTIKAYDTKQALKAKSSCKIQSSNDDNVNNIKKRMLQTGVQHWKTNYNNDYDADLMTKTMSSVTNWKRTSNIEPKKATQGGTWHSKPPGKKLFYGSNSSCRNRPFSNTGKLETTEYKFNYGQKIGSTPLDLLSTFHKKQQLRDNPLKKGTNQLWTQIPNYQGFKPSALTLKQIEQKIQKRNNDSRGDLKLNLVQNYHTQIPGYAGYKQKFSQTQSKLRESCFGK